MQPRTSWLFPLMVLAAAAAIAFGAVGILAITGRAPQVTFPPNPLNGMASVQHAVVGKDEPKRLGDAGPASISQASSDGARR